MADSKSEALFERAQKLIPGGVNSPVRAFRAVGGKPIFVSRGQGAHLFGADGTKYTDYVGSWGPLILGHAHPAIVEAIGKAAANGTTFGAPTELEVRFAEKITEMYPSLQMMRAVSS
ncbi:MAG TPA: aminotransferase class III-fold pyridoxal phosphate-dependent enzyme, partial [Polyangiaceae bacterium]